MAHMTGDLSILNVASNPEMLRTTPTRMQSKIDLVIKNYALK